MHFLQKLFIFTLLMIPTLSYAECIPLTIEPNGGTLVAGASNTIYVNTDDSYKAYNDAECSVEDNYWQNRVIRSGYQSVAWYTWAVPTIASNFAAPSDGWVYWSCRGYNFKPAIDSQNRKIYPLWYKKCENSNPWRSVSGNTTHSCPDVDCMALTIKYTCDYEVVSSTSSGHGLKPSNYTAINNGTSQLLCCGAGLKYNNDATNPACVCTNSTQHIDYGQGKCINNRRDCPTNNLPSNATAGTQSWVDDAWGDCTISSCKTGYELINNSCNQCDAIAHLKNWETNTCRAASCDDGYRLAADGTCEPIPIDCPLNEHQEETQCVCDDGYYRIDNECFTPNGHTYPFSVTTAPTNSFSFKMSAKGVFLIDCGADGELSQSPANYHGDIGVLGNKIIKGMGNKTITCTYTGEPAARTIKFASVKVTGYRSGYNPNELSYYAAYPAISFKDNLLLTGISGSLGSVFPTIISGDTVVNPTFSYTFAGCSNLVGTIPTKLFSGLFGQPVPYMFYYTFYGCSGLTGTIPSGLFGNLTGKPASYMFYATFSGCSKLGLDENDQKIANSYIPYELFAGITGIGNGSVTGFSNTFVDANKLDRICPNGTATIPKPGNWGRAAFCQPVGSRCLYTADLDCPIDNGVAYYHCIDGHLSDCTVSECNPGYEPNGSHCDARQYTVNLDPNGGTGGDTSTTVTYMDKIPTLTSLPTRDGYKFMGYFDSAIGGTLYYTNVGIKDWDKTDDVTLFAHWVYDNDEDNYSFYVTTSATNEFSFSILAIGTFNVDCGESGTLNVTNATLTDDKIFTKTSTSRKSLITCRYTGDAISRLIRIGSLEIKEYSSNAIDSVISFTSNSLLTGIYGSLGLVFPTLPGGWQPRFVNTFRDCANLSSEIPENLFFTIDDNGGCHGTCNAPTQNMFNTTFYGCSMLTGEIPEKLFSTIKNGVCYGVCGAPARNMFGGTFNGCRELKGTIPANLFSGIDGAPAQSMFSNTFAFTGLKGLIPANLFSGIHGAPAHGMYAGTFQKSYNLTGFEEGFTFGDFQNKAPASLMFYNTFYECSGLTGAIPENLFAGISGAPADYMFYWTFDGCEKLYLDANGNSLVQGFIPYALFSGITGVGVKEYIKGFEFTFGRITNFDKNCPKDMITLPIPKDSQGYPWGADTIFCAPAGTFKCDDNQTRQCNVYKGTGIQTCINGQWSSECTNIKCDDGSLYDNGECKACPTTLYASCDGTDEVKCSVGTWNGTYCTCEPGYHMGNDECELDTINCDANAHQEGTQCVCEDGYENWVKGIGCSLTTLNCGANAHQDGTQCECEDGYETWAEGTGCTLTPLNCGDHGNQVGTRCVCDHGYENNTEYVTCWPSAYLITYELNGGTNEYGAYARYNIERYVELPTPTRDGFAFGGWYENADFTGDPVTEIPTGSTGNKTFWAQWIFEPTIQIAPAPTESGAKQVSAVLDTSAIQTLAASQPAQEITVATPTVAADEEFNGWYDNPRLIRNAINPFTVRSASALASVPTLYGAIVPKGAVPETPDEPVPNTECDGYWDTNEECQPCPANATCGDGNVTCSVGEWNGSACACGDGQHIEDDECKSNTQDCEPMPDNAASATQTWSNGDWGACNIDTCDTNALKANNQCTICDAEDNTGTLSMSGGQCVLTCEDGYVPWSM